MSRNVIETLTGAIVLIVAISFLFFAYKGANMAPASNTYHLNARFERADGLTLGSDVRVGGIKVGEVSKETLDPKTYMAVITLNISNDVVLPRDSSAQIVSDGLLGSKYVAIVPGADDAMLKPEQEITFTQSAINVETLIGKLLFNNSPKNTSTEESK